MILFSNVRACESRMIQGSAGMLPAVSGILPDSMQRHTACNMKTPRNGTGNMPAAAGRMPALPNYYESASTP
jgi:hypothetical protein